jgi:hypothetical protein
MVLDMTGTSTPNFSAYAVINAAATIGDRIEDFKCIAMHSAVYAEALANDLIQFIPQSQGLPLKTFRGLAVVIDDGLWYGGTAPNIKYTTVLFGEGAVGYGFVCWSRWRNHATVVTRQPCDCSTRMEFR